MCRKGVADLAVMSSTWESPIPSSRLPEDVQHLYLLYCTQKETGDMVSSHVGQFVPKTLFSGENSTGPYA
jgi:hypothetical protein